MNVKKDKHIREHDLAQDKMGKNSLQGDDQRRVRNQRHAVPDAKGDADDVIESFKKLDRQKRHRNRNDDHDNRNENHFDNFMFLHGYSSRWVAFT